MKMINRYISNFFGLKLCLLTKSQDLNQAREEAQELLFDKINELMLSINRMDDENIEYAFKSLREIIEYRPSLNE